MHADNQISYVELPATDMAATKAFYAQAFGWRFTDYGPTYAAFDQGLDGGFQADASEGLTTPLVVIYADDLAAAQARVEAAGGVVVRAPFAFPGGHRFHFRDPGGCELAVVHYD